MIPAEQTTIRSFRVIPSLPEPLAPLLDLARNFWWTWNPEVASLFKRLDRDLWDQTQHNPVRTLGQIDQSVLNTFANDASYILSLKEQHARMKAHLDAPFWSGMRAPSTTHSPDEQTQDDSTLVAYFCAEFGLAECFQIYSGGLGILAGDHLKAASELCLPLVGVGLLYRDGYFHQYLNADAWQQERYDDLNFANQPIRRVLDDDGRHVTVSVEFPGRVVHAGIWIAQVGRIPLYLLDTNVAPNSAHDRNITRNLYGGDVTTRIEQEMILGIGGVRALETLGIEPTVFHMNEGHSAFLALERIANLRASHALSFDEARVACASQHVFTTHTPVPAGIDRFSPAMVQQYLGHELERLGLNSEGLLALGRENVFDREEFFSMAILALRTSARANAVSKLHGRVSRQMWAPIWPDVPHQEAPIGHITNGVHLRTWLSPELARLLDRYLPSQWHSSIDNPDIWESTSNIPDEELWRVHCDQRAKLISWVRSRLRSQLLRRGAGHEEIERATATLSPDAFTIGFARRFATYKRATLLTHDLDRLKKLLSDTDRPVQILVAGKAHPADGPGKEMIRQLVKVAEQHDELTTIVFLEDYDIDIARRLVRGCDVWLNTPRRGKEASGTSGMKAALNGVINVSILDGWWDEGYTRQSGYAIGHGEQYDDHDLEDTIESRALYDLLERRIIPEFYERDPSGLPRRWIARMKECVAHASPRFNTNRMVTQYTTEYYLPASRHGQRLRSNGAEPARKLSQHIHHYRQHWHEISVTSVESPIGPSVPMHAAIPITADVHLGSLTPEEIAVQALHGTVSSAGDLHDTSITSLEFDSTNDDGTHRFTGSLLAESSGHQGFAIRVLPNDDRLATPFIPGLITWESSPLRDEAHDDEAPRHDKAAG
ncbi:MAG: alpha-glucan family phosphorylase [Phycisphaerales bacterium JB043]